AAPGRERDQTRHLQASRRGRAGDLLSARRRLSGAARLEYGRRRRGRPIGPLARHRPLQHPRAARPDLRRELPFFTREIGRRIRGPHSPPDSTVAGPKPVRNVAAARAAPRPGSAIGAKLVLNSQDTVLISWEAGGSCRRPPRVPRYGRIVSLCLRDGLSARTQGLRPASPALAARL